MKPSIGLNLILLFCLLTMFTSCNGQKPSGVANGTIGDTVSELDASILIVYQDKKNNFWFGSRVQGVYKYDGKNIIHFTRKDGLCSDGIWGIQEDKFGNIYFDTQEGVSKFDGRSFNTLPVSPADENKWELAQDDLWFKGNWNENGPYRYDGKSLFHLKFPKHYLEDEVRRSTPNATWSPYGLYTLYKDRKEIIWFGTSNVGICRYDGKSVSWLYEKQLTETPEGGSFGIRSIFEDKEGKFWFCNTRYRYNISPTNLTEQGKTLVKYKREKGIDNLKAPDGKDMIYFMSVVEDAIGDLWMVSHNQGVWRYDGKNVTHYPVKDGSKDITLFSIYTDRQGELWLGTHDAGAYKFNGKTFEKFKPV